jgi:alkylation response protein AidB-like acyl-CoA dehydrogenase
VRTNVAVADTGDQQGGSGRSWPDLTVVLGLDGITGTVTRAQIDCLRSRAATIAGGSTEIMRSILAERVLGRPR